MNANSKTDTQTSSQVSPWAPQAAALTSAFSNAGTAYNKSSTAVAPTNFTAGLTPDQVSTFQQMIGYGGSNAAQGSASAGANLTSAGTTGATGALNSLGAFNPAATNNTQANIESAKQYAAGQDIPGAVQAAMRDATQTARDVTLPGITQGAALGNNQNSSRTGIAQGLVERGLAQQAGDISSNLYNQAYTHGLDLASNTNSTNNSQSIGALEGAGGLGGNLASTGVGATSSAINDQGALYGIGAAGGAGVQSGNQANLTNQLQQYQSQTSSPFDSLNQLMQIIGSGNWGSNSTGTSTTNSTPSTLSQIGGYLSAGGSLLKGGSLLGK